MKPALVRSDQALDMIEQRGLVERAVVAAREPTELDAAGGAGVRRLLLEQHELAER